MKATLLSSLSFFSVSVISTLEDFIWALLKSCPHSPFCFLPAAVCLYACIRASSMLSYNTDALIEIQRLAERFERTHSPGDRPEKKEDTLVNPYKTCKPTKMNLIKCWNASLLFLSAVSEISWILPHWPLGLLFLFCLVIKITLPSSSILNPSPSPILIHLKG